jgi:hypothetical protein
VSWCPDENRRFEPSAERGEREAPYDRRARPARMGQAHRS